MNDWPHAPVHRLSVAGAYMVTASAYKKEHFFNTNGRLTLVRDLLFKVAEEYGWSLQAWAVMSNHYHFMAMTPEEPEGLRKLIGKLHTLSAKEINKHDDAKGRRVWYQYWDTRITYEKSYFARLNYIHQNPVSHGQANVANQYQWCSARWFELYGDRSFVKTVSNFKTDKVKVIDDF